MPSCTRPVVPACSPSVCAVSDVKPGSAGRFVVGGTALCVVHIEDDWYVIADTCSHADYSLSEGDVFDGQVRLRRDNVREQPANFDARHWTIQSHPLQRRRVVRVPLVQAADDAFERLGGFRTG